MTNRQGSTFKGNPNTNDAARYSASIKRWRDGGCKGPKPEMPDSMGLGREVTRWKVLGVHWDLETRTPQTVHARTTIQAEPFGPKEREFVFGFEAWCFFAPRLAKPWDEA